MKFDWYCGDEKTAEFTVDRAKKKVKVTNFKDDPHYLPFAPNVELDWDRWEWLIRRRCISPNNGWVKEHLAIIGLTKWDPYEIIRKTEGRMAGDNYRLVLVEDDEDQCRVPLTEEEKKMLEEERQKALRTFNQYRDAFRKLSATDSATSQDD